MKSSVALIQSTYLETRKPLLQLLKRRLGCSDTAEDVVQEAYLRVIQQNSVDEIVNLPAYLFRIASNLVVDYGRQAVASAQAHHEPLEEDLICPKPLPDKITEAGQELDLLGQSIAELPPQCRRIFLLHKVQHLSHAEIAERLNISPRTVEKHVGKALKILRDRMRTR
ncbi:RNA polymerase sigma factor [Methylocaldum gracile subsp. desertum]|uniref:RNA polymerase sigma factor n=1 Tax=Methylocaldum sp. GT1BW TaxID=3438964 RepID=UPI003DA04EBD